MYIRSSFEVKVGIFIFIGLLIFSVIVFSVGNFYAVKRGYVLNVIYSFANGINVGAPVRYAGVDVGEVREINVYYDEKENRPMVKLLVWVSENTWINEDAKAIINTLGLLGEKYLEILPGTRQTRLLRNGDTLRGADPVSTEELTRDTKEMLAKIADMVESLTRFIEDKELKNSIKNTALNLDRLTNEMTELVMQAKEGKGTIGRLMSDDKLYNDIDAMILDIKANPWKLLYRPKETKDTKKR